jgi:hypothetical protein
MQDTISHKTIHNHCSHHTEFFLSWQVLISSSRPLRQVLYPSSIVKRTNAPEPTYKNKTIS